LKYLEIIPNTVPLWAEYYCKGLESGTSGRRVRGRGTTWWPKKKERGNNPLGWPLTFIGLN